MANKRQRRNRKNLSRAARMHKDSSHFKDKTDVLVFTGATQTAHSGKTGERPGSVDGQ